MLKFDEKFFEGETIDGFYIEPMMKKAWAAQLEVLAQFTEFCKEKGIHYFADFGTLLGAVRHKGFIPWDDDIDISMLREDYEKLKRYKNELPGDLEFLSVKEETECLNLVERIINGRSINYTDEYLNKYHGCPFVVGLDIEVYDFMSENAEEDEMQRNLIDIVLSAEKLIENNSKTGVDTEDKEIDLSMLIDQIEDLCQVKIDRKGNVLQQLYIISDELCKIFKDEECRNVQQVYQRVVNTYDIFFDKNAVKELVWMPFENIEVPVPVGYDEILKCEYGEDYMTPINKGADHEYPFYQRQLNAINKYN
ncbi:lipopolysaccharide cholinephosphotransferase [Lachnospiraceae bacterium C7]|nr:lipopolysaccharide cholinephosphotransferase [Lachnospiraceae bacterium C7]